MSQTKFRSSDRQLACRVAKKSGSEVNSILPDINLVIEKTPYELTRGRITYRQK